MGSEMFNRHATPPSWCRRRDLALSLPGATSLAARVELGRAGVAWMVKLPRPGPSWRRLNWWLHRGDGAAIILRYHRIAEAPHDPWPLCVSPRHFDQQLEVMSRHANVVPLAELTKALTEGRPFGRAIVDNVRRRLRRQPPHAAKPLLERHAAPATVFVTTGQIGSAREFWWDELERLLVAPSGLPERTGADDWAAASSVAVRRRLAPGRSGPQAQASGVSRGQQPAPASAGARAMAAAR